MRADMMLATASSCSAAACQSAQAPAHAVSREELIDQWRGRRLAADGRSCCSTAARVYLKTPDRLVCYQHRGPRRPADLAIGLGEQYELDGMSQQMAMMAMKMGMQLPQQPSGKPKIAAEVLLFGDRVHQSMAIADGVIYSLEGKRVSTASTTPNAGGGGRGRFNGASTPRRTRSNWLTAYQASGGKVLWTRTRQRRGQGRHRRRRLPRRAGALRQPAAGARHRRRHDLALRPRPRRRQDGLEVVPLRRAAGRRDSPWAGPCIAVEGREAYLTCGCGVVFAVDAVGGTIRWAVRYQRDGKPNTMHAQMYAATTSTTLDLNGWDDDVVIPYGRALVVMSSDSDKLLALDRRTGELLWESPRTSPFGSVASYCLGVNGRGPVRRRQERRPPLRHAQRPAGLGEGNRRLASAAAA